MKGIESLENLIEAIEENMQDIFLIGINAIDNRNIEELKLLAKECNEFGLYFGNEGLQLLVSELENLKRNFEWNKTLSVKIICRLNEYMEIIKAQLFQNPEEE